MQLYLFDVYGGNLSLVSWKLYLNHSGLQLLPPSFPEILCKCTPGDSIFIKMMQYGLVGIIAFKNANV